MSTSLLIAWKYLISKKNGSTSIMIKICFFSISLAVFSLSLIALIMNGFEFVTKQKIESIYPQFIMQSREGYINFPKIKNILINEFNQIDSFSPFNTQYGIIQINEDAKSEDINNVVIIKGIDPENEFKVTKLNEKIEFKLFNNLLELLNNNKIIIGKKLAQDLKINLGSTITILVPQEFEFGKIGFEPHKVFVSGIFNTGIDELDSKSIISSLNLVRALYPESGITHIGIKLKPGVNENKITQILKSRFKLQVYSWKNLYPSLVSALKLEKYVMVFIFFLITSIATMNIISLIFMFITQKSKDIAILKCMGLNYFKIKIIFLLIGIFLVSFSSIFGLILSYLAAKFLEYYPFIELPDVYYATHLPIKIEASIFIWIFVMVMLIGLFACWIPIKKIKGFSLGQLLRF